MIIDERQHAIPAHPVRTVPSPTVVVVPKFVEHRLDNHTRVQALVAPNLVEFISILSIEAEMAREPGTDLVHGNVSAEVVPGWCTLIQHRRPTKEKRSY
jgi:hypothetical protein